MKILTEKETKDITQDVSKELGVSSNFSIKQVTDGSVRGVFVKVRELCLKFLWEKKD